MTIISLASATSTSLSTLALCSASASSTIAPTADASSLATISLSNTNPEMSANISTQLFRERPTLDLSPEEDSVGGIKLAKRLIGTAVGLILFCAGCINPPRISQLDGKGLNPDALIRPPEGDAPAPDLFVPEVIDDADEDASIDADDLDVAEEVSINDVPPDIDDIGPVDVTNDIEVEILPDTSDTSDTDEVADTSTDIPDTTMDTDATDTTELSDGDISDAGPIYPADHIPILSLPLNDQILTPTRAYLSWQDGTIPAGASTWYRSCYAMLLGDVSTPADCPNENIDPQRHRIIDPLASTQSYFWKTQTCYDVAGSDCTEFTPIQSFTTDDSLIGWWRMDDAADTTTVDSSSAGINGTLVNFDIPSAWISGLVGTALLFDASDDYLDLGNNYNFDSVDPFSIEAWTKRSAGGDVQAVISHMDFTSPSRRGYRLSYSADNSIRVQLRNNDTTGDSIELNTIQSFPVTAADPYQALTMTYDGTLSAVGVQLYTDMTPQPTTTASDSLSGSISNSAPTWIGSQVGSDFNTPDRTFDGSLDEVAFYNRVLTLGDITNNQCATQAQAGTDPLPAPCN